MKQSITIEQWNQLSLENKKIFLGDDCADGFEDEFNHLDTCDHAFSIGKMIEFLGEDLFEIRRVISNQREVVLTNMKTVQGKELCDLLWVAVKIKLNR